MYSVGCSTTNCVDCNIKMWRGIISGKEIIELLYAAIFFVNWSSKYVRLIVYDILYICAVYCYTPIIQLCTATLSETSKLSTYCPVWTKQEYHCVACKCAATRAPCANRYRWPSFRYCLIPSKLSSVQIQARCITL